MWGVIISHAGSAMAYLFVLMQIPIYMSKVLGVGIKKVIFFTQQNLVCQNHFNTVKTLLLFSLSCITLPVSFSHKSVKRLERLIFISFQNGVYSALPYIAMYFSALLFGYLADMCVTKNILSIANVRRVANTIGK